MGAYKSTDETTAVATATTDANGNYTLTITTNGQPLDGFLKATKSGYTDTYLYPPAPLVADFSGASIEMLTASGSNGSTFDLLYTFSQVSYDPTKATIALIVESAPGMYVAGATITSSPAGTYRYNKSGSPAVPDPASTSTQPDGIAYDLNVAAGQVMVMAAKSGATFKSHAVKARAGTFTTTLVTE